MWFEDRVPLADDVRDPLERQLQSFGNLQDVVRWAFSLSPPSNVADVIVQDEYCHDVVLPWRDDIHLVFDTT